MTSRLPFYKILYVQVVAAILLGVALGELNPAWGVAMKPLGDGFIKLIKMIIPPVIFCTVVTGIAGMQDAKRVGRVGVAGELARDRGQQVGGGHDPLEMPVLVMDQRHRHLGAAKRV